MRLRAAIICLALVATAPAGLAPVWPASAQPRVVADDLGRNLLRCYHRTGLFERAIEIGEAELAQRGRWKRLPEGTSAASLRQRYEADDVRFLRLYWRGAALGKAYQTDVALLSRRQGERMQTRSAILADTSAVPAVDRLCPGAMRWQDAPAAPGTRL
jgi:hypothetical protein